MTNILEYRHYFPIDSVQKIYTMFERELQNDRDREPDLALFSTLVGAVENNLTSVNPKSALASEKEGAGTFGKDNKFVAIAFPTIEFEEVRSLYERFVQLMRESVDPKLLLGEYSSRELVKRVSDVIWNSLTRSYYKDRAHLQSIYSFLTGNKLDCFGVAFAVTAGCQVLGKKDVHLALSEDHAWVVFGENSENTAEVTWHGKGNEDKRGRSIGEGVAAHSWLYVAGRPVVCNRMMELAALVSSINPTLTATTDVHEVAVLQHRLLWMLYRMGHLDRYPMALGNLADLHEYLEGEVGYGACDSLYLQSIESSRSLYGDRHVYPYTFRGGHYHRRKMYKEAFNQWACAGDVIRHYNYSRDDEEIYKEFAEIANELIPQLMKVESSGHSAHSILKEPECFASLLRFYDGICKWEEGSPTPVLHIGWAKPLVSTIAKFDAEVRARVRILCSAEGADNGGGCGGGEEENTADDTHTVTLHSHKMAGLRRLLLAQRLNTHAISLQLTAQSQLTRHQHDGNSNTDNEHHYQHNQQQQNHNNPNQQQQQQQQSTGEVAEVSRAKRARRER